jgi:carbamoyl-phosphate synthase large subunit
MFPEVDPILGPEMRSTGEVLGMAPSFGLAFYKSQQAAKQELPLQGTVLITVTDEDKKNALKVAREFQKLGFRIKATEGTYNYFSQDGVKAEMILKMHQGRPNIVDAIKNGRVQLVFNTTEGAQALADSRSLRRAALLHKVPYYTTLSGAVAAARGIKAYLEGDLEVRALQSYFGGSGQPSQPRTV